MMNNWVIWPQEWPKRYNACTDPCDMAEGPCVCGAWHSLKVMRLWMIKARAAITLLRAASGSGRK